MSIGAELRRSAGLWREAAPGLRKIIWISFIESMAVNLYVSLIVPYCRALGYDSHVVGTLSSLLQIVSASVAVLAGVLADRLGRKSLYVAGQVVRVLAVAALLLARNYVGLIIVFALRGMATIQAPAQSAITADLTRRENRATMLGLGQTLGQFASVIMPVVAGIIADRYGAAASFAAGLVLAAVAVGLGLSLRLNPAKKTSDAPVQAVADTATKLVAAPARAANTEPLPVQLKRMFSGGRALPLSLLIAASVANGFANGATNILLPFTVMDRFSSAYAVVASMSSMLSFGTMLVLLIGGRVADIGGRRRIVIISSLVFPLIMASVLFVNTLWELAVALILTSMVGNISSPAIGAVYMEAVEDRDRATFAGLQMSLNAVGMASGSALMGITYTISANWSWVATIIVFASQAICYHFILPREKRPPIEAAPVIEAGE